ncbi:MAG TPA: branched-chain-amino-acid transaminase [Clostridia bacterium]|nr:branched-chain-amino-acid transaminase [Clostridia bacterium]
MEEVKRNGRFVYLDGTFVPVQEAKVSVFDHGFLYGDGVFEGIRAYSGRIFKLKEHLKRLYDSARSIKLQIPVSIDQMERIVVETVRKNELKDAYIRLVVSRGPGDLGLDPRKCPKPFIVVIADSITLYPEELYRKGMKVITSATRRVNRDSLNPRVKSLNYLNSILAKIEATTAGFPEVIILDENGYVLEGSGDNIFIVRNGSIITPPVYLGILEGITRNVVFDLAKEMNVDLKEHPFTRHDVYVADECFMTGTAAEIIPIVEVDGRVVGSGEPGKVTVELMKRFKDLTATSGTPVYEE